MNMELNYNIVAKLHEMAQKVPEKVAIVMQNKQISFKDLSMLVKRAASGFENNGIAQGDSVVVMVPMSIDLYVVMLGAIHLGAVCIFFDPWLAGETVSNIVNAVDPKAFVSNWKGRLLCYKHAILRDIPVRIFSVKKLIASQPIDRIFKAREESRALITFSTGSSGVPKGADRTHGFLLAQHEALKESFPPHLVSLNMFPIFALNNLGCGTTSIIPSMNFKKVSDVNPRKIYQQIRKYAVTSCTASPPFFDQLAKFSGSDLTQIITGGGIVADEQLRIWQKAFPNAEIIIAYGSTEAEPVAHITAEERLKVVPKIPGFCMGKPVPQIKAKIIKITTAPVLSLKDVELPLGEIGELVVSGDHVCKRYYQNPEANRANKIHEDGVVWHRMGDTGYLDEQGYFWLVGRVHSTIHFKDTLIHPQQVDYLVRKNYSFVKHVAVVCVKDQLIIVTDTELPKSETTHLLAENGIPVDVVLTLDQEFPVDPRHNTKIDYKKLAEIIEGKV